MWTDPIVEELHRIREAHVAQFDNDLRVILRDLRKLEAAWSSPKIDPASKPAVARRRIAGRRL